MIKHLRRPCVNPDDDGWWPIRCDCGWVGRTPCMGRTSDQIDSALEQEYKLHLPADEARTHLLVDSRQPDEFQSLDQLIEHLGDEKQARAAYAAQCPIVGTFVMPIGEYVVLIADRVDDGTHFGTYQTLDGGRGELPVGEVRTSDGAVWRLSE